MYSGNKMLLNAYNNLVQNEKMILKGQNLIEEKNTPQ
jgi:hypothetical protein